MIGIVLGVTLPFVLYFIVQNIAVGMNSKNEYLPLTKIQTIIRFKKSLPKTLTFTRNLNGTYTRNNTCNPCTGKCN